MILEIPEAERAIIKSEHLDQIVIETRPKYATDQILNILGHHEHTSSDLMRVGGRLEDHVAHKVLESQRQSFEDYQRETLDTTLGDFFRVPYTRTFDTKPKANEYADHLRSSLLPKIRALLEKNRQRPISETIEF